MRSTICGASLALWVARPGPIVSTDWVGSLALILLLYRDAIGFPGLELDALLEQIEKYILRLLVSVDGHENLGDPVGVVRL
jgi:hypothetical protein